MSAIPKASKLAQDRLSRLQSAVPNEQIWVLTDPAAISYATGYPMTEEADGQQCLLLWKSGLHLFYSTLAAPAPYQLANMQQEPKRSLSVILDAVKAIRSAHPNVSELCIDPTQVDADTFRRWKAIAQDFHFFFQSGKNAVLAEIKMIKLPEEQEKIRQAVAIAKTAEAIWRPQLKEGMSEAEAAALLHLEMTKAGAEYSAFPTIVAFNEHSATPHHVSGRKKLQEQSVVLVDWGARYDNYASDLSNTFWFGPKPSDEFLQIRLAVAQALVAARSRLEQPGELPIASELDDLARAALKKHNLEQYFTHALGHGLGIAIHEAPLLAKSQNVQIKPGMVFTLEPGVYLPGKFGVRIEETIVMQTDELQSSE